jgi:resuscitation-promoting factor RpfA
MLISGNGCHRKPRQAPNAVVAVAATGAGMALSLLSAGGAQAADNTTNATWTAVAQCESGGVWSSNTGNGFYGGLQISQDTWDEYGGKEYAERPDLASISQQMEVADKMLAALGPDAWPGCADKAGLKKDDGALSLPTVPVLGGILSTSRTPPPGTGETSGSDSDSAPMTDSPSSASPPGSPAPSGSPSTSTSPSPSGPPSAPSPASSPPSPASSPPSTHSSPSAPFATPAGPAGAATPSTTLPEQAGPEQEPAGESACGILARDGHPHRGGFATGSGETTTYRVRAGDNLWCIAAEHGVSWHELYHVNRAEIGDDPALIRPGEHLTISR